MIGPSVHGTGVAALVGMELGDAGARRRPRVPAPAFSPWLPYQCQPARGRVDRDPAAGGDGRRGLVVKSGSTRNPGRTAGGRRSRSGFGGRGAAGREREVTAAPAGDARWRRRRTRRASRRRYGVGHREPGGGAAAHTAVARPGDGHGREPERTDAERPVLWQAKRTAKPPAVEDGRRLAAADPARRARGGSGGSGRRRSAAPCRARTAGRPRCRAAGRAGPAAPARQRRGCAAAAVTASPISTALRRMRSPFLGS